MLLIDLDLNPGAPPLLLVHGGRDHCRNWDWVAARCAATGTSSRPTCAAMATASGRPTATIRSPGYVYDLAQLIHQQELAPVTIVAHSLGGVDRAALHRDLSRHGQKAGRDRGAGAVAEAMSRARESVAIAERMQDWIDEQRALSGRLPRRYASIEDAFRRMQEENRHLSPEQARHLTLHGVNQNEDGTYSWKFDNYVRAGPPYEMTVGRDRGAMGADRLSDPPRLRHGKLGVRPTEGRPAADFRHAKVVSIEDAGHWVHHDRLDVFLDLLRGFL